MKATVGIKSRNSSLPEEMQNALDKDRIPPGFIEVPSKSRPGEKSFWSQVLGQKFATIGLAWIAYEKAISAKRDKRVIIEEDIEKLQPASPRELSPKGPLRKSPQVAVQKHVCFKELVHAFTDSQFPPNASSIGKTHSEDSLSRLRISPSDRDGAHWVRLPEYLRSVNKLGKDAKVNLFGDIEPNSLIQGIVGDCWLLATMACLAEFPYSVEALFCGQKETSFDGKYTVKLFNLDSREWELVTIDDYIPCKLEDDFSQVPFVIRADGLKVYDAKTVPGKKLKPLFAVPHGNQMWAALLEKAVAKFVGSYALIAGGHEPFAMIAFTGFPQVYQFKRVPTNKERTVALKGEWERGWAQWAGKFSPSCGYRPILPNAGEPKDLSNNEMFSRILEYDRMNYLLAASIVCYPPPSSPNDSIRPDGLVNGHAYSLLSVEQFDSIRLVKLRNPHGPGAPGHSTDWNGPWSDSSDLWTKNPDIALSVGHQKANDGIFWMEFSDFADRFDKILVLPLPMNEPRGAISSMRRAKMLATKSTIHRRGAALAGMALDNLTHLNEVVTAIHLMSIRPYDPYLNAPDWVRTDQETYNRWAHEKLGTSPTGTEKQ